MADFSKRINILETGIINLFTLIKSPAWIINNLSFTKTQMKTGRLTKLIIGLILVVSNVSCDQITKNEARENISPHERIEIVKDSFILTNVENTGAALSFGADFHPTVKLLIFQIIPIIVLIHLFYFLYKNKDISKLNFVALSFFIGGGIGNIIDRVLYNSVTDFMYLEVGSLHTGVFNMADVSVTLAALLLAFSSFTNKKIPLKAGL